MDRSRVLALCPNTVPVAHLPHSEAAAAAASAAWVVFRAVFVFSEAAGDAVCVKLALPCWPLSD